MKRILLLSIAILFCILIPQNSIADHDTKNHYWELDLDNGFISTKPIIIGDSVIVRTSGFWTGEDRPKVYSFDLQTGEENWRYTNDFSTNHDLSPLVFVQSDSGDCGSWDNMVIVGWTDGRVTALDFTTGNLIWQSQTEVVNYGITGAMALDSDEIVVPTNKGLSRFCLADGSETLRVELSQTGWRNGITVTEDGYLIGDEGGVLNHISKDGIITSQKIGEGKIRHAPLETPAGILVHLQSQGSSSIFVDEELISTEGPSPAIPILVGDNVYLGTLNDVIKMQCDETCSVVGRTNYRTNGEIVRQYVPGQIDRIWFSSNTLEGGWSYGVPGENLTTYDTKYNTFKTAGPGFSDDGSMAFGDDNGILMVTVGNYATNSISNQTHDKSPIDIDYALLLILILILVTFSLQLKSNQVAVVRCGLLTLLVVAIVTLPEVSTIWSKGVSELQSSNEDWDDDWPNDWQGTQVLVIELQNRTVVDGGYEGYNTVEELTDIVASNLGVSVEYETTDIGVWITSFDGITGSGWEFTVDGTRSNVGISLAELDEGSVVRWSLA